MIDLVHVLLHTTAARETAVESTYFELSQQMVWPVWTIYLQGLWLFPTSFWPLQCRIMQCIWHQVNILLSRCQNIDVSRGCYLCISHSLTGITYMRISRNLQLGGHWTRILFERWYVINRWLYRAASRMMSDDDGREVDRMTILDCEAHVTESV